MGFTDLSWVKNNQEEKQGHYICVKCGPMPSVMEEVTDPKLTEFLGPNRHRYRCPKCGDMYDSKDPIARIEEMITTLPGDTSDNNNTKKIIKLFSNLFQIIVVMSSTVQNSLDNISKRLNHQNLLMLMMTQIFSAWVYISLKPKPRHRSQAINM